jgi:hypothetical protein
MTKIGGDLLAVRAVVGVDAAGGEAKALDGAAVDEVFFNYFVDILFIHEAVPDGFRVDDEDGPVFALVETAGFVDADAVFQAGMLGGVLEMATEFLAALEAATGAGGGFVALVCADKDVVFEAWHGGLDAGFQLAMHRRNGARMDAYANR